MSHYCKICGRYRPNEKFSGKGHAAHICKECAKIPLDKRNEMETINHINTISPWMSKKEREWLQKMTKDKRENVRLAAESAWKSLSAPIPYEEDDEWESDEYAWLREYPDWDADNTEDLRAALNSIVDGDDDDLPF